MTMTQPGQPASFVEIVARKREPIAYVLIALGVALLSVAIFWSARWHGGRSQTAPPPQPVDMEVLTPEDGQAEVPKQQDRGDYLPSAFWAGMLAGLLLVAGAFAAARKPVPGNEVFEMRMLLIIVGGSAGLLTAFLGFVLAWRWQDELVRWVNLGAIGGAKWIIGALAIFLGGLVLMFFSVQLARAEERRNVLLRRVLYGSNAVLTGLLILMLLAVVNIIVFLKLPDNMISTASAFKGLNDPSKELLNTVTEDVNVYLIMPENMSVPLSRSMRYNGLYADCRSMLNACYAQNKRIKTVPLSPVSDGDEINRTMKRLKVPEEQVGTFGMLIGYGKSEEVSAFIPYRDLFSVTQEGVLAFQGENRLMTELNFLIGGGQRPIVYFTQSNDEPSIGEAAAKKVNIRTMRALVSHLQDRKYEVRPLLLERGKKLEAPDAAMIIIVAPRIPFDREQIDLLAEYLKPKQGGPGGKIVALLPAFPELNSSTVSRTGLEPLFADYGIDVAAKQRLLSLPNRVFPTATNVLGTSSDESREADHPLGRFFDEDASLIFGNVRPISANTRAARRGMAVMNVLASRRGIPTYRDDNFNSDPAVIADQVRREFEQTKSDKTIREKLITNQPVPFAAYAAERIEKDGKLSDRPQLLVIGTDWFASDDALRNTRNPQLYIAIMGAMIEFVRERPRGMLIEPRELGTYNLPKDPDGVGLLVLPIGLVVLGILGLGVGVWVSRRR
jgi:ABC-type uncharacterized transport system